MWTMPRPAYLWAIPVALAVALVFVVQSSRSQQPSSLKWEYQVIQLGPTGCSGDELPNSLNAAGNHGWEMVGLTLLSKGPSEIVLQTASLGYGREVVPNLTDSWQGVISPIEAAGCQVIMKRPIY